jgi:hypothetical protein
MKKTIIAATPPTTIVFATLLSLSSKTGSGNISLDTERPTVSGANAVRVGLQLTVRSNRSDWSAALRFYSYYFTDNSRPDPISASDASVCPLDTGGLL